MKMKPTWLLLSWLLLPLLTALAPADAQAATFGVTVTIDSPGLLISTTEVDVPVTVTCSAMNVISAQVSVSLVQGLVSGSGSNSIQCDGTTHTYRVTTMTSVGTWQTGTATASANAVVDGWIPISFCQIGPNGVVVCTKERQPYTMTASAGPTTIEVVSAS